MPTKPQLPRKGDMAHAATKQTKSSSASRLQKLRERSACRVHKAIGDPEALRAEGLSYYEATKKVRARANQSARERE